MYGRDDLHAATARLMDRMNVDEWTAQTHLPVIRSIIATGNGPEDLALLLGLEDLTGVGIDHAILARLIRWYGANPSAGSSTDKTGRISLSHA